MPIPNATSLIENHEIALLHADVCAGSPASYSLAEKRQICESLEATSAEIEQAIRQDFEALPPQAQAEMLDLLQQADPDHFDWWMETLAGKMPASAGELC